MNINFNFFLFVAFFIYKYTMMFKLLSDGIVQMFTILI